MKLQYVNYKKEFPQSQCWKKWISVTRYWGRKLIYIQVRHHALILDRRENWIADFLGLTATNKEENDPGVSVG